MIQIFLSDIPSTLTYFFLATSILSLWICQTHFVWLALFLMAGLQGIVSNRVSISGLLFGILFCGIVMGYYRFKAKVGLRVILGLLVLVISVLFGMHLVPVFNNWKILSEVRFSSDAIPISTYLNFDKTLVGLFIIGWGHQRIDRWQNWKSVFRKSLPIIVCVSSVLLGLSLLLSYVKLNLKWFEFSWIWLLINLLFTCVAEEALFRGFLQHELTLIFQSFKKGSALALVLSSLLFGLVHFKGGWTYIALASVAGCFYGLAYTRTKRLEASILTHFAVNAIHFIAFTYPALMH